MPNSTGAILVPAPIWTVKIAGNVGAIAVFVPRLPNEPTSQHYRNMNTNPLQYNQDDKMATDRIFIVGIRARGSIAMGVCREMGG